MLHSPLLLLRLHRVPGIGQRTLQKILAWANGSDEQLAALFDLEPGEIGRLFNLKEDVAAALKDSSQAQAESLAAEVYQHGFQVITRDDPAYPMALRARWAENAPAVLYLRGTLAQDGLAFSGSRHVSEQGISHATGLVRQAVERRLAIISGHAPGVDVVAHRTALEQGGTTVIVLPEGVLHFKLRAELQNLYQQHPQNIIVVSEFPPQMPWSAANAMIRNKTIIGLSQALCIIEAGDSGGTLKAGEQALALKVPVFVLDYPVPPPSAVGNKRLLGLGAHPIPVVPQAVLPDLAANPPPAAPPDQPNQLSLFGE